MIIYNVTTNIHESVHDKWMIWMQHKHIPEMIATGKFVSAKMARVLIEEEMGGVTYSVQYVTDSIFLLGRRFRVGESQNTCQGLFFMFEDFR